MSPKLPIIRSKKVIQALGKGGFSVHHQTGSHVQMKHYDKPELRITIHRHSKDVPKPIIRSIIKQDLQLKNLCNYYNVA